jgi:LmbE family N-acetylglucosaminyl deacetylase
VAGARLLSMVSRLTLLSSNEPWRIEDGERLDRPSRLLGVFAHPDDETFCAGGTFARHAQQGAEIMVVSATRGQAGQIRDANAATRRTIGAVREEELRQACARLGVSRVRCLNYSDGNLAGAEFALLVDEVAEIIREFRPDGVITFGPDGGYGHPDHIAISAVTAAACRQVAGAAVDANSTATARSYYQRPRLYYRCFPQGDVLLMERLARWLVSQPSRFTGTPAFAHALLVLAEEADTLRHIRDHVQVRWYPPGSYVVEQGERATDLYLVLSGVADVWKETAFGEREHLARLGVGEFFGELGIAGRQRRSADVLAGESLTCLVLSAAPPAKFAGRGRGARLGGPLPGEGRGTPGAGAAGIEDSAMVACDVSGQLKAKVEALCAYRTQLALDPEMFPEFLLQEIFGCEYFQLAPGAPNAEPVPGTLEPRPSTAPERATRWLTTHTRAWPDHLSFDCEEEAQ